MYDEPDRAAGRRTIEDRLAGAPISWGVSEVPGWGYQLGPERVLAEMQGLGLAACEFGPIGFLADDPADRSAQLRSYGITAVGGFVPILLHDPEHDPLNATDAYIDTCLASEASCLVLAAATGSDGYDERPALDELGWKTMFSNLDRIADRAEARGITASLHPHIGTMVEQLPEVERTLAGSRIGLCLDTGHLAIGGAEPVVIATTYADRVAHVHLKDVDAGLARSVASGEITFADGVRAGVFCPLGRGDLDITALVSALEAAAYQGWYVLEQDVMLDREPDDVGPAANVRQSLDYLREMVT